MNETKLSDKLCECGCGQRVNKGRRYIKSHVWKGRKHSEETKRKISNTLKGRKLPKEVKRKISESSKGKHISEETKRKISNTLKGRKLPKEVKRKISESLKGEKNPFYGKHHSEETKKRLSEIHKGMKLSEEAKRKISESLKGRSFSEETLRKKSEAIKGEKHPFYGKHLSEEHKRKISESVKKAYQNPLLKKKFSNIMKRIMKNPEIRKKISEKEKGEKHHNWRGGISFLPYCEKFNNDLKENIRKRDNYTCQLCGKKQIELNQKLCVHHIHYDKKNCNPDLISLCHSCHGKVNYNRDYWEDYFMNILKERNLVNWEHKPQIWRSVSNVGYIFI